MRNKSILLLSLLFSLSFPALAQKPAYTIFNAKGKKVSYKKMMKGLSDKELIFFGEYHNNPIAHWLQFEVTSELSKKRELILGAEMFEADNQDALDQYLAGKIDAKGLDSLARLWNNYKTDYAPLVNIAKKEKHPFIATNIPRRYARIVNYKDFEGLDSLNSEEKAWIAPLPIVFDSELPQYKNMLEMMGGHGSATMVKAQAIKDATMAHFILKNHKDGALFIHYNGAYHSDFYEGILWYVKQQKPEVNAATITTVSQKDLKKLEKEHLGRADFIICVDENMTTTY
ncbi:ChaN family lipoprotein [Sediminitomix flava]|uniref:Putative iron-regulated protein n=1 Tax=Sediminitomix flava TaxID=379075 RepID=A0A315Z7W1_SEDFL|nr:ChaN family lipoprotein [Sediminitomix flava]PWJ40748.1 putative iron-regulated protein [Sediminitomix flava]